MTNVKRMFGAAQLISALSFMLFYNLPINYFTALACIELCAICLLVSIASNRLREFKELPAKFVMQGMSNDGVYLLKAVNNLYKIGLSTDIDQRLRDLSAASPFDLTLEHVIPCCDLKKAEAYLHALFAARRVKGEWFALTDMDVAVIKGIEAL